MVYGQSYYLLVSLQLSYCQGDLRPPLILPYSGKTKEMLGQEAETQEKKWVKTTNLWIEAWLQKNTQEPSVMPLLQEVHSQIAAGGSAGESGTWP